MVVLLLACHRRREEAASWCGVGVPLPPFQDTWKRGRDPVAFGTVGKGRVGRCGAAESVDWGAMA